MAELINLQGADRYLQLSASDLENLKKVLEDSTRKVWSDAQRSELAMLSNAVASLRGAVIEIMHNNRDDAGRGLLAASSTR